MATKVISEIESFSNLTYFKIGIIIIFLSFTSFFLLNNKNTNLSFVSSFNYIEGLEIGSNVVIAGIKVGEVTHINLLDDQVIVKAFVDNNYLIPSDSIIVIRSNGIFGKKSLLIEPGFDNTIKPNDHIFTNTKDSYSIDMFLRYLKSLNV